MPIKKAISCKDDYDPLAITPDDALATIFDSIKPISDGESVALRQALNRVLAADIVSSMNVPPAMNAAMDGYAINAADIPVEGMRTLKLIGTGFAGVPFDNGLNRGECVRIMTGAVIPAGADTVVMQEHVRTSGKRISIDNTTQAGDNVRQAGEDLAIGDPVLAKGLRLRPADIGLLASLGLARVEVGRRLRIAFFSTGDELRSAGTRLDDGAIYDSNRYTLHGMLTRIGAEIIDMGIIKDDRKSIDNALLEAAGHADVLITSGGVSVGEADYVKASLLKQGQIKFWKVAMKPGRPFAFGTLGGSWFFGLPGNPVSVMVSFYQFVQPALKKLAGENLSAPLLLQVPCRSKLKKRAGRVEYQRGILEYDASGELVVRKTGAQGSGILRSMADANCFIVLPLASVGVAPGERVAVQPFHGIV